MWDTCASTPTKDLNYQLLLEKMLKIAAGGNHHSYMCLSMHMCNLLLSYSCRPERVKLTVEVVCSKDRSSSTQRISQHYNCMHSVLVL